MYQSQGLGPDTSEFAHLAAALFLHQQNRVRDAHRTPGVHPNTYVHARGAQLPWAWALGSPGGSAGLVPAGLPRAPRCPGAAPRAFPTPAQRGLSLLTP